MSIQLSERLFGIVAIYNAPSRIEGDDLVMRSRIIEYARDGAVVRDEIVDGARVENGAHFAYLFPC